MSGQLPAIPGFGAFSLSPKRLDSKIGCDYQSNFGREAETVVQQGLSTSVDECTPKGNSIYWIVLKVSLKSCEVGGGHLHIDFCNLQSFACQITVKLSTEQAVPPPDRLCTRSRHDNYPKNVPPTHRCLLHEFTVTTIESGCASVADGESDAI